MGSPHGGRMIQVLAGLAGTVVEAVSGGVRRRQERRAADASAAAKLRQSAQDDAAARDLAGQMSRAEWEAISRRADAGSWKDEYITIIVTLPIVTLFAGALLEAVGVTAVSEAGRQMIAALNGLNGRYADLLMYVALAAIGIRYLRGRP